MAPPEAAALRVLALVPDAWSGYGGIAQFNRDFLHALQADRQVERLHVVSRLGQDAGQSGGAMQPPDGMRWETSAWGKAGFAALAVWRAAWSRPDVIVVGHINFAWLGWLAGRLCGATTMLVVHGAEAWRPRRSALVNSSVPRMGLVAGVSRLTLRRLAAWCPVQPGRQFVLPNCVDIGRFQPGSKPQDLAQRYGLAGRRVLMTLGRLASAERFKGFDEVMDLLPRLVANDPRITYLVCGQGDDEPRLRRKAADLGVGAHVVFAGYVAESEKPAHYRLADAFIMASRAEGFGIVVLEALASGLPVLASSLDATGEVMAAGFGGVTVDPANAEALYAGILEVLELPRLAAQPAGLTDYAEPAFRRRVAQLLATLASMRRRS